MSDIYRQREHDDATGAGVFLMGVFLIVVVATIVMSLTANIGQSETEAYDYAGPDGTLTGVPYTIKNYVVEDHDTGVYYFLLQDSEGNIALCPRYEADGTLWQHPLHKEASE